ncbi:MAG: hypothetical protein ACI8RD_011418, partial [Bacillariaceae sp.]
KNRYVIKKKGNEFSFSLSNPHTPSSIYYWPHDHSVYLDSYLATYCT